jgi:hypothetical protein
MGIQIPMLLKKHYALIFKGQHDYSWENSFLAILLASAKNNAWLGIQV